jgi:putative tryptophan/tyrosine transport system substrate-binding protein
MLAGASAAWPSAVRSQVSRRLGVLLYSTPEGDANFRSLRRGLADLGHVEGKNLTLEIRAAEGQPQRLPGLAEDLVRAKPDVVFSLGGDVTIPAARATRTIPLVFATSADPVRQGIVASLARPGGNATGVTFLSDSLASKRLEILKEAVPHATRVAFLWNPDHPDNELAEAERAAASLEIELKKLPLDTIADVDTALAAAAEQRVQALYVVSSRLTGRSLRRFVDFAAKNRLPLIGGWGTWTQSGALLSFGPNLDEMVRRAATYVDKIFNGSKPAELPVQQPSRFELAINLKTAKAFGLDIAQSLIVRADQVIE